jgi:hypothetical protein
VRNKTLLMGMIAAILVIGAVRSAWSDDAASTQPVNLALKMPATCSSDEGAKHPASMANDGDEKTRWCAKDATVPQWWQVDLGKPATVTGCEITWEFDGKHMQYVVEGSADGNDWKMLSDQSKTTDTKQTQSLTFDTPGQGVRYIRVTITGDEPRAWASICEVRVWGKE